MFFNDLKRAYSAGEHEIICNDFKYFCTYLLDNKQKVSSKTGIISNKAAFEINNVCEYKEVVSKASYKIDRYPIVNFLYSIIFGCNILKVGETPVKSYLENLDGLMEWKLQNIITFMKKGKRL